MATTKAAPGKKGLINFDFLQKLGKVLMTVIALSLIHISEPTRP